MKFARHKHVLQHVFVLAVLAAAYTVHATEPCEAGKFATSAGACSDCPVGKFAAAGAVGPTAGRRTMANKGTPGGPADELSSKRGSIRDVLLTQEAANTMSQAVGVSVDVPEAPYIDGPLSRSVSSLICEPGLQCGDAGCPKCVCDCSC